ncbi:four helix bundle protein [Fodinibius sp.]|uniref:four helix bundle protein n=1 Tax=Fodinibius sp. TaxID=1872440 RepID=UPI002ACE760E|nr:four helix bundle protein [Fodinibius sp.]MDZ7658181.1 four helix bundle protein [Fodinibius sp.]
MIKSYEDLEVYERAYQIAMEIFWRSKQFPKEEKFSLTSQVIRSSRSISSNITEGWAKRNYENYFKQHLIHALGSSSETENWIKFANNCNYISEKEYQDYKKSSV